MNPATLMLSSKRAKFGIAGMILMFAVSIPWFGIPADTQEQLRTYFAGIIATYIAGQTVTDVATRGRTSGSHSGEAPAKAPKA